MAKLVVVVHYLPHQFLNHLLAYEAIVLACQFSDRLRDRVNDFICYDYRRNCVATAISRRGAG
jgi:hypothetical protein